MPRWSPSSTTPGQSLEPAEAVRRWRAELMEKYDNDFIPYTFQVPISIAVAKLTADFRLADLVVLDEPQYPPHVITENFWRGWQHYHRPTLVSFNGRGFDLPLLELAAFRYGLSLPGWFQSGGPCRRAAPQPLQHRRPHRPLRTADELRQHAVPRRPEPGGQPAGKAGKMDVHGDMVQDLYNAGRLAEINDYCRCDVLDTYFVFLRSRVLCGHLTLETEQQIIAETKTWLEQKAGQVAAYRLYLDRWGDWPNPWQAEGKRPRSRFAFWPGQAIVLMARVFGAAASPTAPWRGHRMRRQVNSRGGSP